MKSEIVKSNEVTCTKGHRVYVVWVAEKDCFAFECTACDEVAPVALSCMGWVMCVLKYGKKT